METVQMYGPCPHLLLGPRMQPFVHYLAQLPLPAGAPVLLAGPAQLIPVTSRCATCAGTDLISFTVPASMVQQHVMGGTSVSFSALPAPGLTPALEAVPAFHATPAVVPALPAMGPDTLPAAPSAGAVLPFAMPAASVAPAVPLAPAPPPPPPAVSTAAPLPLAPPATSAVAVLPPAPPAVASVPVMPAAPQQPVPFLPPMTSASMHITSTVLQAPADAFILPSVMKGSTEQPVMVPVPTPSPAAGPPGSGAVGSWAVPSSSASRSIAASPASVSPVSPPSPMDRRLSHTPLSQEAGSDSDDLILILSRGPDCLSVRQHQQGQRATQRDLWMLPPCQVSVRPINPRRFWDAVRQSAMEACDWDLLERVGKPGAVVLNPPLKEAETVPSSQLIALSSPGGAQGGGGNGASVRRKLQAFPVHKAVPNSGQQDKHEVIAWEVVQDLQDKVAKHGLGSAPLMQVLRVMNTDLLAPYDIKHLASVLFQPVQMDLLMSNWRRMADRVAAENQHYPQTDPRCCVGVDALMGLNNFASPDFQATWHHIVLEQAQKIGFAALLKTMETAAHGQ
nr:proline-rich protein 36-like [Taeniopygia guttata]